MNFRNIFLMSLLSATTLLVTSCEKAAEPEFNPNDKGSIVLEFDNVMGNSNFNFNTIYKNAAGEDFQVDLLQYYVSNIKLKDEKGKEYIVPQDESYFLVKEQDADSQEVKINNVPAGNYVEMTFTLGVDSLRNTADISKRTGVLDIGVEGMGKGMYWSWNSGYIFFKMEGTSPTINSSDRRFRYHIGGFGGYSSKTINNLKTITCKFGTSKATVRKDLTPAVHTLVDALKLFNGTTNLSIKDNSTVMFAPFSVNVSANYANMFSVHHIHNDK
jgi:hypothetical protein